jgi:hypothetical protein
MTTISEPISRSAGRTGTRRNAGAVAGLLSGPLFLTLVLVLTLARRGMLHHYGWTYLDSNDIPWPSGLSYGGVGVVQIANFAVTGILVMTFARALSHRLSGVVGRIGAVVLFVQGLALFTSSAPVDHHMMMGGNPATWHGWVHEISFPFVAVPSLLAPLLVGLALRRDPEWRSAARVSFVVPLLLLGAFFAQSAVGDLAFTGFLIVVFGWEALVARRLGATGARVEERNQRLPLKP